MIVIVFVTMLKHNETTHASSNRLQGSSASVQRLLPPQYNHYSKDCVVVERWWARRNCHLTKPTGGRSGEWQVIRCYHRDLHLINQSLYCALQRLLESAN